MPRSFNIGPHRIWPPFLLAPMAGESGSVLRRLCKRQGAGLVCTEFTSSDGLYRGNARCLAYVRFANEERPLAAQIVGADPHVMADAARRVVDAGADIIDINMGCWVPKVAQTGAGAALLQDLTLAAELMAACVRAVDVPVTIKTRVGWDGAEATVVRLARAAEDVGVEAIAVHGRTAEQGFRGEADWAPIAQTREAVSIPVIGNGDVRSPEEAARMLRETGCHGVMIGRHALGNPWCFRELNDALILGREPRPPSAEERIDTCWEHARLTALHEHESERDDTPLPAYARPQLGHYLRGMPGAAAGRHAVANARVLGQIRRTCDELRALLAAADEPMPAGAAHA